MKNGLIIVGAFHEIIELAEDLKIKILGLIDNEKKGSYKGYKIIANDLSAENLSVELKGCPIIITPDIPKVRAILSKMYQVYGFDFCSLISNTCKISKSAVLGKGVIIQHGANVSAETKIGDFVKLNTNANVMHDCTIGSFSTIAPNAIILGNVKIGESCYIGANSTILPNVSICENVIVGAGAVVTKSIVKPGTFAGVPARQIGN
ncbi:NeuD/PglB/VioB family sugar acetyltransferase [Pedobacter gandavensis]|uniref:NeuD/PglB/VioB family sugar acetyltransferase n=1 Tax=Pedobacter gandavensis TaxID=2679963 RepID=UPI0029311843|nr:NeuD/PglB/VioB family sugar acetyltransferase [Pedobacter gandavensis]